MRTLAIASLMFATLSFLPDGAHAAPWCADLAEFERSLILARTEDGRKRAMARGVRFGRLAKDDVVVVTRLDRLARSTRDLLETQQNIFMRNYSNNPVNTSLPCGVVVSAQVSCSDKKQRKIARQYRLLRLTKRKREKLVIACAQIRE